MDRLRDKVAVITGGSSGIGLEAARRFLQEGASVVITGRRRETLDQAVASLGERAHAVQGDVSDPGDLDRLFAEVRERHDRIDVLFLNAGVAQFAGVDVAEESLFEQLFSINVKGPFFAVQKALPLMGRGGSIILTTSATNQVGLPGSALYAASKAALRSLARTLSADLTPRGIRVNAISPGPIETPIYDKLGMPKDTAEAFESQITEQVPLKRFGRPDEIAGAVAFLASDDSSYVVGAELVADGGFSQL